MSSLVDLFEYNHWANQLTLDACDRLTDDQRAAPMPELGGSVLYLLDHTARVQQAFLALMTGGELPARVTRTYDEVRAGFDASDAGFLSALPDLEPRLGASFNVPWFERDFTLDQGLLQVATHSVQHRAGICAGIARGGVEAPGLDFIMWLEKFR